ncbi:ABC transporter permease [Acidicapsa acidisoli]|uniref:ABC transporter permease n=1 Tax=Acidicapsa acidisoli TaxID=1615681 RepID=UPI0021E0D22C|nr:ABC transporter permease [Acidicapsa acidisoli]
MPIRSWQPFGWLGDEWQCLRLTIRSLSRTPGFTLIATLVVALGIGVNTAVFSVVNAVLFQPLTYPEPQTLVQLLTTSDREPIPIASIPEYNIWQQQSAIFRQVAAYDWGGAGINLTGGSHPEQVRGGHVTSDYFPLFGAPVIAGRTFTASEDSPNGGHVVVLSYGLWKSHFGANPNIVGSSIQLDDQSWLVIGVIGRKFVTDTPIDLWIPFQLNLDSREMARQFNVAARLKPGITIAQANAQLLLAAEQFRRGYGPDALPPHGGFRAVSLQESLVGTTRFPLMILLGAVGFVLLIACANVANLLLARASVRKREFAIRTALGAGRGEIVRMLLMESLTLSITGGLLGLVFGFSGVRLLLRISPGDIPRIGENGSEVLLDYRVMLFTLGISVLTGVLFGLAPIISTSRPDITSSLNENSSRSGTGLRHGKASALFVTGQMALALILVIGAALLIRTFQKLESVNPGFTTRNVLSASMSITASRFQRTEPVARIVRDGRQRLLSVPGVIDASASSCLPLQGCFGMGFDVSGRPKGNAPSTGVGGLFSVSSGYFSTFEIPVLRGRSFTEHDGSAAPGVIIINQAMARQYWPDGDPLRDRIQIGAGGPPLESGTRQVIGIVGDTRDAGVSRDPFPTMYIPIAQMPDALTALNFQVVPLWWIVRSQVSPYSVRGPIESALGEATGGLPVAEVRTMDEVEARDTARQRFNMVLLTIFGIAGLLMAAIGVYGVMSYSVQQRTQEMGVRMALGAQASDLRRMVIGQGMRLALLGLIVGLGGAFYLTRFLSSFLFGVKPWDPVAFIFTPLLLGAVALSAIWIPARRATRVDPMTALRLE